MIYTLEGIGTLFKYEHEVQILTLWPTYTTHVKDLRVNGHPDRWPAVPGPNHPSQFSYFCHTTKPFCFPPHWNDWNEHPYPVCCGFVGSATLSYTKLGGDEWTLYLEWFVTHDWNKASDTGMFFFRWSGRAASSPSLGLAITLKPYSAAAWLGNCEAMLCQCVYASVRTCQRHARSIYFWILIAC